MVMKFGHNVPISIQLNGEWEDTDLVSEVKYECSYCGALVAPTDGYKCVHTVNQYKGETVGSIYICNNCNFPTFFDSYRQIPHPKAGENLRGLSPELNQLYNEVRDTFSIGAYTATVLLARKMLMNLAVSEGAEEGKTFAFYIDYLENNGHITARLKPWVDKIRTVGNKATHSIPNIKKDEAHMIMEFLSMLLKLMFEYPLKMETEQT